MLKADIKLPFFLPIITIIAAIGLSFLGLSPMTVIIYIGTIYILTYYISGFIRRKDAIVITESKITVKTPFRNKEFLFDTLQTVYIMEGHTQIKGITLEDDTEKAITICSAIYTESIDRIYETILFVKPELKRD